MKTSHVSSDYLNSRRLSIAQIDLVRSVQRRLGACIWGLFTIGCVSTAICQAVDAQQLLTAESVVTLTSAISSVHVQGSYISRIVAGNDGLLFVVCLNRGAENCTLVHTSLQADAPRGIPIDSPDEVLDVAVDRSKADTFVLLSPKANDGSAHLKHYSSDARVLEDTPVPKNVARIAFMDGSLYALTTDGQVSTITGTALSAVGSVSQAVGRKAGYSAVTFLSAGPSHLLAVDRVDASIDALEVRGFPEAATLRRVVEFDVWIAVAKAAYAGDHTGRYPVPILAATGDASGRIYCMLSGFKAEDGAPVIVLDGTGRVLGRFRVSMRSDNKEVDQYEAPMDIAVAGGKLFVLSASNHLSTFRIPQ